MLPCDPCCFAPNQFGRYSKTSDARLSIHVGDLDVVYPALRAWQEKLAGAPVPFSAVRTPSPMAVPGCNIVADMWVYNP